MGGNLGEFLKVFLIVITMSSLILSLRSFITNFDSESEDLDLSLEESRNLEKVKTSTS